MGAAAVPVGGGDWTSNTQTPRPIGGRREACGAWPGFEPTRRAKLAARTASGRAGHAAAGDLSGQQAPHTPRRHNKTARPQCGRAAVAVVLGFEPRVAVTPHSISSAAPSAARTRYLTRILYYILPPRAQIDRVGWEQGHTTAREQGHTTPRDHTAAHETDAT